MILLMLGSIWLSLFGQKHIKTWMFLGGFFTVSISVYIYAPTLIDINDFCCGKGTEETHVVISVVLGLVVGVVAIFALKLGVFLSGTCLGLGASLAIRTTLAHMHVFQSDVSFAMFYGGCALLGGVIAMYKDALVIALATSFAGSFGFFVGVGHFADCRFTDVLTHVEKHVEHSSAEKTPEDLPRCAAAQGFCFVALFVATAAIQLECYTCCGKGKGKGDGDGTTGRRGPRHRWVRTKVSDQEYELLDLDFRSSSEEEHRHVRAPRPKRPRRNRAPGQGVAHSTKSRSNARAPVTVPEPSPRPPRRPNGRKGHRPAERQLPRGAPHYWSSEEA